MHKTIALVFLALAVVFLILGLVWFAVAMAAGGAFAYWFGPRIEGERRG